MHRARRLVATTTMVALTLIGAGCGVEAGHQATTTTTITTTTAPKKTRGPGAQATIDQLTTTYRNLGFSGKDSKCLAEGLYDQFGSGANPMDQSALMDVVNQCNVDTSKILKTLGGGSPEDVMRRSLIVGFKSTGMTEKQASCMADAFVEQFGTDMSAATDAGKLQGLMQKCDVDPSKLRPGG